MYVMIWLCYVIFPNCILAVKINHDFNKKNNYAPSNQSSLPGKSCDARFSPANGGPGNCSGFISDGSICRPTCNPGWTLSSVSRCHKGSFTVAVCTGNPCNAFVSPIHGDPGDCPSTLSHRSTCRPSCKSGWKLLRDTKCYAGNIIVGICIGKSCDASTNPINGGPGDCPLTLDHGSTCQPSCNPGWIVSGVSSCTAGTFSAATCIENRCTCTNGTGATGTECPKNGTVRCAKCNLGFYNIDGQCNENRCICNNGIGAIGDTCYKNEAKKCITCNAGFHLSGDNCLENKCVCSNGIGAKGTSCHNPGGTKCIDCNKGFHLNGGLCIGNSCNASSRPINGDVGNCSSNLSHGSMCQPSCDPGWELYGVSRCSKGILSAATCVGRPCSVNANPINGGPGDCEDILGHGESCQPSCNSGWRMARVSRCYAGKFMVGLCVAEPCSVINDPKNGGPGDCPLILDHGFTCRPSCNEGWKILDVTSCKAGILTEAICIAIPTPSPTTSPPTLFPTTLSPTLPLMTSFPQTIQTGNFEGVVFTPSPTHSPTHSSTHSPTRSPTHSPTASPTTSSPTTSSPTTSSPTTSSPTTSSPTTASPTTSPPTIASPTTASPTTASPTASPTTASPTTASPISSPTASPTASPTTASPTASPTTASPTTASPTAHKTYPITGFSENGENSMYIYSPTMPFLHAEILITGTHTKFDNHQFTVIGFGEYQHAFSIDVGGFSPLETYGMDVSGKWSIVGESVSSKFTHSKYVMGNFGNDTCPEGSKRIRSIGECTSSTLLRSFNTTFGKADCYAMKTSGCIRNWGTIHFNTCDFGFSRNNNAPICKIDIDVPKQFTK